MDFSILIGLTKIFFAMPIFIIALNFGVSLFFRLFVKRTLMDGDPLLEPTVTVLLPVYNEGQHVLETIESIIACDYPREKLRIIAIDDCSADDSFEWICEAQKRYPNLVSASRNETNSGKHKTLAKALKQSTSEIVICIDSDCIFEPDVIRQLVKCFSDPKIAAVGGSIGISNVNDNVATAAQALIYWASFQIGKMLQNYHRKVMCISGCLFAVRRHLFEEIENEISGRSWFGISIRDGEDRYMTHNLLMKGWKTYINPDARCWTHAPNKVSNLFMQQVRWRRSGLRDLWWTFARLPQHIRVFGMIPLLVVLIPEIFTMMWAFLLLGSVFFAPQASTLFMSFAIFGIVYTIIGIVYNSFMKARGRSDLCITHILLLPVIGIWHLIDAIFTTTLALFTFDNGTWGTRELPKGPK